MLKLSRHRSSCINDYFPLIDGCELRGLEGEVALSGRSMVLLRPDPLIYKVAMDFLAVENTPVGT